MTNEVSEVTETVRPAEAEEEITAESEVLPKAEEPALTEVKEIIVEPKELDEVDPAEAEKIVEEAALVKEKVAAEKDEVPVVERVAKMCIRDRTNSDRRGFGSDGSRDTDKTRRRNNRRVGNATESGRTFCD